MILVSQPSGQRGPHDAHHARAVPLEIAVESADHEFGRLPVVDMRMAVVENKLPVDVANVIFAFVFHQSLGRKFGVKRRARDRAYRA